MFVKPDVAIVLKNYHYYKRIKSLLRPGVEPQQLRLDNLLMCSTQLYKNIKMCKKCHKHFLLTGAISYGICQLLFKSLYVINFKTINGLNLTVGLVKTSVHLIDMTFVFIQRLSIKTVHETNAYCHLNQMQSRHLSFLFFFFVVQLQIVTKTIAHNSKSING